MIEQKKHPSYEDAERAASEYSRLFGYAWIIRAHFSGYQIAVSDVPADAPKAYLLAFKDGNQQ